MSDIDFVVLWVDSNDTEWQKKKSLYKSGSNCDVSTARYRDWDNLKYWFRAVEKYAPWVRKVHFVSDNQVPEWMNTECKKLHIVSHSDYIPLENLPLFNASSIEVGIHNIPDLSNKFVFFNDDIFLTDGVTPEYFFTEGLPNDMAGLTRKCVLKSENDVFSHLMLNNYAIINRYFDKKCIFGNFFKWYNPFYLKTFLRTLINSFRKDFDGLVIPHLSTSYLKSDFSRVWDICGEELAETQTHKFRQSGDLTHLLFRFYRMCKGDFYPKHSKGKYYSVSDINVAKRAAKDIIKRKYPEICLNDCYETDDFDDAEKVINNAFEVHLSKKSSFEK